MSEFTSTPRVIIVEPTSSTSSPPPLQPGQPPVATSGYQQSWLRTEISWGIGMFGRIFLSVAIHRLLRRLWHMGYSSPGAYENAGSLSQMGRIRRGYSSPRAPIFEASSRGHSSTSTTSGSPRPAQPAQPAQDTGDDDPPFIATVDGYELYNTRKILEPTVQKWPCPVKYRNPCDDCWFGEEDQNDVLHCSARIKLAEIMSGQDTGASFQEIREWIRQSK